MKLQDPSKLTSALIARKGHAVPSGFGFPGSSRYSNPALAPDDSYGIGHSVSSERVDSAACGAESGYENSQESVVRRNSTPAARRARVSLRLDDERHLRLRLSAAHMETTLQNVLVQALDHYLDQISPEVIRANCLCLGTGKAKTEQ